MSLYHRLHDRFGAAGVVVGVVALVVALGGSAFAAKQAGLNSKQKEQVKGIAKSFAGKDGAPGTAGTPGTNGTNGKDGANGTNGEKGNQGDPGTNGKNVVLTAEPEGANCLTGTGGGTKVEVEGVPASKRYVCNGKKGVEGSPWTAGGTLPSGATETGAWSAVGEEFEAGGSKIIQAPISFTIPLANDLDVNHVKYLKKDAPATTECPGTASAPKALAGYLCVYTSFEQGFGGSGGIEGIFQASSETGAGASTTGARLFSESFDEMIYAGGTWAVTAL